MADLNTLIITNAGLTNINKKVADSRTFNENLITKEGNPNLTNGVASNFSSTNYFTQSLSFPDSEKIKISLEGTFYKDTHDQCIFELKDSNGTSLNVLANSTEVTVNFGSTNLVTMHGIQFYSSSSMKVFLVLTPETYEFTIYYGDRTAQKTGTIPSRIDLSLFNSISVGSTSTNRNLFWMGSLDLKSLSIYNNNSLIYTPTTGTTWEFSYLMISNGEFPLTDNSYPIADRVYRFDLHEITRTDNSILLTTELDQEAHLLIKEVGIYINTPDGPVLYGKLTGLNVHKEATLPYELIININTTINVVNAAGFPQFIVTDPIVKPLAELQTVEEVNLYVLTNLETIINMNATLLGYNKAQTFYRMQQQLERAADCFNTIDTFAFLLEEFCKITKFVPDPAEVEPYGEIPEDGVVSDFTSTKYLDVNAPFYETANWEVDTEFSSGEGTPLALVEESTELGNPLQISVEDDTCNVSISRQASFLSSTLGSYYLRDPHGDIDDSDAPYSWKRQDEILKYFNFHCGDRDISTSYNLRVPTSEGTPAADSPLLPNVIFEGSPSYDSETGILSGFHSILDYAYLPVPFDSNWTNWELVLKIKSPLQIPSNNVLVSISNTYVASISSTGYFTLNVNSTSATGTNSVELDTDYWIKLSFTGSAYNLAYSTDGETYTTDCTISSSTGVSGTMYLGTLVSSTQSSSSISPESPTPIVAPDSDQYVGTLEYFDGSINLLQTYLNVDGAKYWEGTYKADPKTLVWEHPTIINETEAPTPQVTYVGTPTYENGTLSNFSNNDYALLPSYPSNVENYEIVVKFTTGETEARQQGIIANSSTNRATPQLDVVSEGTAIQFGHPLSATTWASPSISYSISPNTTYWVKATWNGQIVSMYVKTSENSDYSLVGTTAAATVYWSEPMAIGIDTTSDNFAFNGSVDLTETYININNERWWTGTTSAPMDWSMTVNAFLSDIPQQYILGRPYRHTNEYDSVELYLQNGRLKLNLYEENTKENFSQSVQTSVLTLNRNYRITIGHDEGRYYLHYEMIPLNETSESTMTDTIYLYSSKQVSFKEGNSIVIGRRYLSPMFNDYMNLNNWITTQYKPFVRPYRWNALTFYNNRYVGMSSDGSIATSWDGENWNVTVKNSNLSPNSSWQALTYGNNKYVAISGTGYTSTSTNGETWADAIEQANLSSYTWITVAHNGTIFLALSTEGYTTTSTDGDTWENPTEVQTLGSNQWSCLLFDGEKFVAISNYGDISTSTDGSTWTTPVRITALSTVSSYWSSIVFDGTKYVALCSLGCLATSEDLDTWTVLTRFTYNSSIGGWTTIAVNDTQVTGKYLALSSSGVVTMSSDLETWSNLERKKELASTSWKGVAINDDKVIYLGENGLIAESTNGSTWNIALPEGLSIPKFDVHWLAVCYGNGIFLAIGTSGWTSTSWDGVNWGSASQIEALQSLTGASPVVMTFDSANSVFVLLDNASSKRVLTSPDGEAWTEYSDIANLQSKTWRSITYGDGVLVALANGNSLSAYISTSEDGETWTTPVSVADAYNGFVVYDGHQYIIPTSAYILTSPNLKTWKKVSTLEVSPSALAFGNGTIFGLYSSNPTHIFKSVGGCLFGNIDMTDTSFTSEDYTWHGATSLDYVYTNTLEPTESTPIYDDEFFPIKNAQTSDFTHETITASDLFAVQPNKTYKLKIVYSEDEEMGTYAIYKAENGSLYSLAYSASFPISINQNQRMALSTKASIGGLYSYSTDTASDPFTGSIYLFDTLLRTNDIIYQFKREEVLQDMGVLQYYRLPDVNKSYYVVKDACDLNRTITFTEDNFQGNRDLIDLTYEKGLTICAKVHLKDSANKLILLKSDLGNQVYFAITFFNQTVAFHVITYGGVVRTLSKHLEAEELASYTTDPIFLTLVEEKDLSSVVFTMYKNNEKLDVMETSVDGIPSSHGFILSNFSEVTWPDVDQFKIGKYLKELIVLKGVITKEQLYYLNLLMDTNY